MKKSILIALASILGIAALVPVVGLAGGTAKSSDCCAVQAECCPASACCK